MGYTGYTLSINLSFRLTIPPFVSSLYLQQYLLDPFHIYTFYQATLEGMSHVICLQISEILSFGKFFKFLPLTLSCFDMGYDMNQ